MSVRDAVQRVVETYRGSGALWTAALVSDHVLPLGVQRFWRDVVVPLPVLRTQVERLLAAWGMSAAHVEVTAEHLLYADLHGIDSHGCAMLHTYHRDLRAGTWTPRATPVVVHDHEAIALIDGGGGLGHVPADVAMQLAIEKSTAHGVGAVAVRASGHFGAAGAYVAMAARAGLIGLATTGTRVPSMVPSRGIDALLGTNPIAFAAPATRNRPFLLDMATSTAPLGRLALAAHRGRRIPRGWALDPRGRPVRNARRALGHRRLTPLGDTEEHGGHKGYGLASMVEVLSAVLPGLRAGRAFPSPPDGVGHFFLAIDPERFRPGGGFASDVDALLDGMRSSTPADTAHPVLVAGDPQYAIAAERRERGIPLARSVVEDIRHVARSTGVPFVLDDGRRKR